MKKLPLIITLILLVFALNVGAYDWEGKISDGSTITISSSYGEDFEISIISSDGHSHSVQVMVNGQTKQISEGGTAQFGNMILGLFDWGSGESLYTASFSSSVEVTSTDDGSQEVCQLYDHKECYDGDPYWYDSCGNRQDRAGDCGYGYECVNGKCVSTGSACEDKCSFTGYNCINNDIFKCVTNSEGCRELDLMKRCASNEECVRTASEAYCKEKFVCREGKEKELKCISETTYAYYVCENNNWVWTKNNCPTGYTCENGECNKKGCKAEWLCLDSYTLGYKSSNCEITIRKGCENGCHSGVCIEVVEEPEVGYTEAEGKGDVELAEEPTKVETKKSEGCNINGKYYKKYEKFCYDNWIAMCSGNEDIGTLTYCKNGCKNVKCKEEVKEEDCHKFIDYPDGTSIGYCGPDCKCDVNEKYCYKNEDCITNYCDIPWHSPIFKKGTCAGIPSIKSAELDQKRVLENKFSKTSNVKYNSIIFIHGFGSYENAFLNFQNQLDIDSKNSGGYPNFQKVEDTIDLTDLEKSKEQLCKQKYPPSFSIRITFYPNKIGIREGGKSIKEYASRLDKIIKKIKECQIGNYEFILISHSMGGLVAREYAASASPSWTDKIITIGTPNQGVKQAIALAASKCNELMGSLECNDLVENSKFITQLMEKEKSTYSYYSSPIYTITGIGPNKHYCSGGDDGLICEESVYLPYANNNYIVKGSGDYFHGDLIIPSTQVGCEVYSKVREILGEPKLVSDCSNGLNMESKKKDNKMPIWYYILKIFKK